METMHIAICDDEEADRTTIVGLLQSIDTKVKISEFSSAESLLANIDSFDLLFLDIHMPGMDGLSAARTIRISDSEIPIIFVTALRKYVFESFDVGAFHYLLKPIKPEKLREVYLKARTAVRKQQTTENDRVLIQTRQSDLVLKRKEILYAETVLKKIAIHTTSQRVEFYSSIRSLEHILGKSFYRCHRGYLVNMEYIREYRRDRIVLTNGETILLAKERYPDFVEIYTDYLRDGGACFV